MKTLFIISSDKLPRFINNKQLKSMSISSVQKDNSHKSHSGIFSFGAPNSKSFSPFSPQGNSMRAKDSKLGYVLEMIQKYELQQNANHQLPGNTIDPIVVHSDPMTKKMSDSRFLSYLSTSRHLNTSYDDEVDDSEPIPTLNSQQHPSHIKFQLQETHQTILDKYITPIRLIDCCNDIQSQSNYLYEEYNNVSQFIHSSEQQIAQSQLVDRNYVPLVESLIMSSHEVTQRNHQKQVNRQVEQETDLIDAEQRQDTQYIREKNHTRKENNSSTVEGDLKISQLIAFCLIVLALLLWKM